MKLGHFIRRTSRKSVIDGLQHISKYYIPKKQLLSSANPLDKNAKSAISNHANAAKAFTIRNHDFRTYLAASSVAHMLDGWMYLSNSINSLLSGDEGASIHLAYYAELRSAMSILATEGLGVFDKKHFGAFDGDHCEIFKYHRRDYNKGATHQFVWTAMDKWASSAYKPTSSILKLFKVRGKNFYELTEYFHPSVAASNLLSERTIKKWLKDWCFDIKSYKADREGRNEVSYRPQRIKNFDKNVDFKTIISSINSFWNVLSPSGGDKYTLLDSYLLRKLFQTLHQELQSRGLTTQTYSESVRNAFEQYGISDQTLFRFLDATPPYNNDHSIFQLANIKETTPLSIIARASLLLRISVGMVSQLCSEANLEIKDLNFVWENYGIDNGFWAVGESPTSFNSLWNDISISIEELNLDLADTSHSYDMHSIFHRNPEHVRYLSQINRASLWGLDF
ncbi:hypothetical protein J2Y45_006870 [Dyadobacter sp. BE34]|uniref:Uncharacterized protein n=1 Tax=Dyadobacter fermentans TaxID=94254 RepID=A0ABU1R8L9_9BACT|nr:MULTISPECIES: hypothetical protein [Dyadobacter]MDR6809749.1 hypothetical protein [Dyadobacter fermentans]MDR7047536.1 hypothetical protein [Dyadobacter sp. BE242]MDR7201706.1 hypothetical protein [Dyadobacter sp. BE34]MDR7219576.1 hypothetical protein [Dyadobacter sp. BE31]MDR7267301.1 hypothetical protein [Dyadobacter sp. BE32]